MLDPVSIAAIVAPYLAKGAEALAKTAGEKIGGIVGDLAQAVANKFKGDSYAEQTLERAREKPESKERENALKGVLAEKLEEDPDFAEELRRLVDKVRKNRSGRASTSGARRCMALRPTLERQMLLCSPAPSAGR